MADTAPAPHPAVAPFALAASDGSVRLAALADGAVLQVVARRGRRPDAAALAALGDGTPHAVRPTGPDGWLIVGDMPLAAAEIRRRAAAIAAEAVLVDASHGWTRLVLSGPGAADLAATGTGIDLDPAAFPPGASAATLYGLVAVHLTRTGPDAFEILVPRSYGRDLADGLAAAIRRRAGDAPAG